MFFEGFSQVLKGFQGVVKVFGGFGEVLFFGVFCVFGICERVFLTYQLRC